jgi:hypothetical protein
MTERVRVSPAVRARHHKLKPLGPQDDIQTRGPKRPYQRQHPPDRQNRQPTILECCEDMEIWGAWFKKPETWSAWMAYLAALFGLDPTPKEYATYVECTQRVDFPTQPAEESTLIVGRRGGKSFVLALIGAYLACFRNYSEFLAPAERATIPIIGTDRRQCRIIFRYVKSLLSIPLLKHLIEKENRETLELTNGVTIEIHTSSFRSTRGYACPAILADEVAFWPTDDAAEPDYAVFDALRPSTAQFETPLLIMASSPYWQKGALFDAFEKHYGHNDSPVLVWKAPTRKMNSSVRQSFIDAAYERDPASAASEYGAEFRTDIAAFVTRDALLACVSRGVRERPALGIKHFAFVDPSGGSSDSMTLAIGHNQNGVAILDFLREIKAPFSPEHVVDEFVSNLRDYRCNAVTGDRYAAQWVQQPFKRRGINYMVSTLNKSEIYLAALPLINSRRCDLLDDKRMIAQFCGLGRRTARGGRDSIDHAPNSHDDVCNVAAGCIVGLQVPVRRATTGMIGVGGDITPANTEQTSEAYRDENGLIRIKSLVR